MPVGFEKINLYAGRFYLDIADLAKTRSQDPQYDAMSREYLMHKICFTHPDTSALIEANYLD